jgi:hypothetical protein
MARHELVHAERESPEVSPLLFLDDALLPPKDAIPRRMAHDVPIVSGHCECSARPAEQAKDGRMTPAERIADLGARLAKDSDNSSKTLAREGLARKTKSLRKRSGKRPGG